MLARFCVSDNVYSARAGMVRPRCRLTQAVRDVVMYAVRNAASNSAICISLEVDTKVHSALASRHILISLYILPC